MLRKLIKHDLKSLNHILPVMHGALLIITLLFRFFMGSFMIFPTASLTSFFLYTIFLIIIMGATTLLIGIHFYKSLFSDEGYLTHTLPVTSSQLLLSKTAAGSVWISINITLTLLCACIMLSAPPLSLIFHIAFADILILFLTCILQGITDVIIIYASVSMGQYSKSRPVLSAIVIYFAIAVIRSIINTICTVAFGVKPEAVSCAVTEEVARESGLISYDLKSLSLYIILAVVTIAILYPVTQHVLKRKINLA